MSFFSSSFFLMAPFSHSLYPIARLTPRTHHRRKPRDNDPAKANSETAEEATSYFYPGAGLPTESLLPNPAYAIHDDLDLTAAPGGGSFEASDRPPQPKVAPSLSVTGPTDDWRRPQASLHHGTASPSATKSSAWPGARQESVEERRAAEAARPDQLQWVGERSMKFGSDITYTFYPFLETNNLSNILPQDVSYLEMQGCFRVPTKPVLDELVKQYFLHVHPIMPLFNEGEFWEIYGALSGSAPGHERVSLLVFQAMLFSACRVSRQVSGSWNLTRKTDETVHLAECHPDTGVL